MTSDSIEDKYPSLRDALFNQRHLINLKCGIEYLIWQVIYVGIALFGVVLVGGALILSKLGVPRVLGGAKRVIGSETLQLIASILVVGLMYVTLVVSLALMMVLFVENPVMAGLTIGGIILYTIAFLALNKLANRYGDKVKGAAHSAGSKATETPLLRRIWGKCPVSFKQPPQWFDKLFGEEEF